MTPSLRPAFAAGRWSDGPSTSARRLVLARTHEDVRGDALREQRFDLGRREAGLFGEHLPASTMVEVSKLGSPELLIEIDAIALAPAQAPTVAEDEL